MPLQSAAPSRRELELASGHGGGKNQDAVHKLGAHTLPETPEAQLGCTTSTQLRIPCFRRRGPALTRQSPSPPLQQRRHPPLSPACPARTEGVRCAGHRMPPKCPFPCSGDANRQDIPPLHTSTRISGTTALRHPSRLPLDAPAWPPGDNPLGEERRARLAAKGRGSKPSGG